MSIYNRQDVLPNLKAIKAHHICLWLMATDIINY